MKTLTPEYFLVSVTRVGVVKNGSFVFSSDQMPTADSLGTSPAVKPLGVFEVLLYENLENGSRKWVQPRCVVAYSAQGAETFMEAKHFPAQWVNSGYTSPSLDNTRTGDFGSRAQPDLDAFVFWLQASMKNDLTGLFFVREI